MNFGTFTVKSVYASAELSGCLVRPTSADLCVKLVTLAQSIFVVAFLGTLCPATVCLPLGGAAGCSSKASRRYTVGMRAFKRLNDNESF